MEVKYPSRLMFDEDILILEARYMYSLPAPCCEYLRKYFTVLASYSALGFPLLQRLLYPQTHCLRQPNQLRSSSVNVPQQA